MARAPWLPPKTSRVGGPLVLAAIEKNAARTGTPVTLQWGKYWQVSSKCTAAAETQRAIILLANPGTTFGSKASVGRRRRIAATIAGPEAYPPTPITTSGSNSESMREDVTIARGRSNIVFRRVIRLTFFSAPT